MGIVADFTAQQGGHTHVQHTALTLYADVLNVYDNPADLTQFSGMEYTIADKRGAVIVKKTLGHGITVDDSVIQITVSGNELKRSGTHRHSLVMFDSKGQALLPVFNVPLFISPLAI